MDFKNYVLGTMFYRYISENLCSYINNGEITTTIYPIVLYQEYLIIVYNNRIKWRRINIYFKKYTFFESYLLEFYLKPPASE